MQKIARLRRYVSPLKLYAMLPALRYSYERGAYVLRFVGETHGPVLRKDRRSGGLAYSGPERRLAMDAPAVDPALASRPTGGVRVVAKTPATKAPRGSRVIRLKRATGSNAATGQTRDGPKRSGGLEPAGGQSPPSAARPATTAAASHRRRRAPHPREQALEQLRP